MPKNKPVRIGSILSIEDVQAYYIDNPILLSRAEGAFPLKSSGKTTWKTISNAQLIENEAADHMSLNSTIPVSGRPGFKDIIGEMTTFGKGYEWNADEIEEYNKLKADFDQLGDAASAIALLNYYGDDLTKVRTSMTAQMSYMDWSLISNACEYSFLAANSIYMQGITAMLYPITAWQKDAVATTWANDAALILNDIQSAIDVGDDNNKSLTIIYINKKWFGYVRQNTQIRNQTLTLVGKLLEAENNPNLEQINAMLSQYFDEEVRFEVINEKVVRSSLQGVKTKANPFKDGVAVFAQSTVLGHFEWNKIPIIDPTSEVYENFFLVGNYVQIDPSYAKIYGKGRAFPVVDSYADNFYLKVDAVAWS